MAAAVKAQSLRGYRELVGDLGGNANRLLRKADIDPRVLDQLTGFIRFANLIDLLELSAADRDCPDFGLRLAERQDIGILGTLSVAMRNSTTVGDAMRCAATYIHVYNGAIAFDISTAESGRQVWLEFKVLVEHAPLWAQTVEHGIGLAWRILTLLSEGRSHLQEVRFPHRPVGSEAAYRARFPAPLHFQADRPALAVTAADFDLPISESNQDLHDLATRYMDVQVPRGRTPFTTQVRQAIEALLGTGTCSYKEVARALYMHPRTLQRRLRDEGTSFEEVKDEVRRDLARRYLAEPDVPLTQVTMLLDYSEQSAFGRSCRRWFDTTPSALRDQLTA